VKAGLNPGGPSPKAKYSLATDSGPSRATERWEEPRRGEDSEPETTCLQALRATAEPQKIVATRLLCSLQYRVCGKVVYSGFFCLRYFELRFDPSGPSLDDAAGSLLGSRAVLAAYRYPPKSAGVATYGTSFQNRSSTGDLDHRSRPSGIAGTCGTSGRSPSAAVSGVLGLPLSGSYRGNTSGVPAGQFSSPRFQGPYKEH
jgi:hypothetical protein